jgi:hypothetical protein
MSSGGFEKYKIKNIPVNPKGSTMLHTRTIGFTFRVTQVDSPVHLLYQSVPYCNNLLFAPWHIIIRFNGQDILGQKLTQRETQTRSLTRLQAVRVT